jgi:protein-S-isoprenylcysteine O-methyltransferase Ste14
VLVAYQSSRLWIMFQEQRIDIRHTGVVCNFLVIAYFALARTPPVQLTLSPLAWLISLLSTLWGGLVTLCPTLVGGIRLVEGHWVLIISLAAMALAIWARFSLGSSFGLVPAQRAIVTTGAYRFVRHPIYGAVMLTMVPGLLGAFSAVLVATAGVCAALMIWRAHAEERFLVAHSEEYRAYVEQVRYRFFPYLF